MSTWISVWILSVPAPLSRAGIFLSNVEGFKLLFFLKKKTAENIFPFNNNTDRDTYEGLERFRQKECCKFVHTDGVQIESRNQIQSN